MTVESYDAYAADRPDARFTDWLRERAEPDWTDATTHRFTQELAAGTIDDAVFRRYLVQDAAFVGTLADVVGYAAGQAPTLAAKRTLAGFLGTLTDEENDFFERAFDALDVPVDVRADPPTAAVTEAFQDLLCAAALGGGYEETLAVLVPVEWCYLTWASRVERSPDAFYLREWIELHDTPAFASFVDRLREELDAYGPRIDERRRRRVERHFRRAVALEVAFFEMAYE